MRLTASQLRRIIKEEVENVASGMGSDRSVLASRGQSYNSRVAEYIGHMWGRVMGRRVWEDLLDHPDFKVALDEWFEANESDLDPGVPKAQMFIDDANIDVTWHATSGGGHTFTIEITPGVNQKTGGLNATYDGRSGWSIH